MNWKSIRKLTKSGVNKFNAAWGLNIKQLQKHLDEKYGYDYYHVSVVISSAAHKDSMRIMNKNTGNSIIFKLHNGYWTSEYVSEKYYSIEKLADDIDDIGELNP